MNNQNKNIWNISEIDNYIDILTDYTANGSFASLKENVKYYNTKNYAALIRTTDLEKKIFIPERFTDKHGYEYLRKSSLYGGEIVIANVGSTGKIYLVPKCDFPMTLAPNMYLIKFKSSFDNLFGYYLMSSPFFQRKLKSRIASTTLAAINKTALKTIKIPVPSIKIQQKIALVLSTVDEEIQKIEKIIDKTEKLKNGLMSELLTRGIGHTNFKKTKIGEMPQEWELRQLDQITLNITDGKHGDCKNESNSGYFFVSVKDIHDGVIDYKNARQITKVDFEEAHKRTKLEVGDLLVTNSGTIGRMAIILDKVTAEKTTFQKSVAIIKPDTNKIDVFYLMYSLKVVVSSLVAASNGSAQVNLLLKDLRSYCLPLPPIKEQNEISSILMSIDSKITIEKGKRNKLVEIKNGLMNDIFNQKVEVNI